MNVPPRLVAALALLVPALVGFQVVLFYDAGALLMVAAAYVAARATGYARDQAPKVAVGCGLIVGVFGGAMSRYPGAGLVGYALAVSIALRPANVGALVARLPVVLGLALLGASENGVDVRAWGSVHRWWLLFAAVPLVSAIDALLGREVREPADDRPFVFDPLRDSTGQQLVIAACAALLTLPVLDRMGGNLSVLAMLVALVAGVVGTARAVRTFRSAPLRSAGTVALAFAPVAVVAFILFWLLVFALGGDHGFV